MFVCCVIKLWVAGDALNGQRALSHVAEELARIRAVEDSHKPTSRFDGTNDSVYYVTLRILAAGDMMTTVYAKMQNAGIASRVLGDGSLNFFVSLDSINIYWRDWIHKQGWKFIHAEMYTFMGNRTIIHEGKYAGVWLSVAYVDATGQY